MQFMILAVANDRVFDHHAINHAHQHPMRPLAAAGVDADTERAENGDETAICERLIHNAAWETINRRACRSRGAQRAVKPLRRGLHRATPGGVLGAVRDGKPAGGAKWLRWC